MNIDRREHIVVALLLAVFALAVVSRDQVGAGLERLDWPLWDAAQSSMEPPSGHDGLVIVLMDDESLVRLGERWPLDRSVWARFLLNVASYKPAVVALDAWFETPSPNDQIELAEEVMDRLAFGDPTPTTTMLEGWLDTVILERDSDRAFSQAMGRAGRVVLGVACPIRDRDALQVEKKLTAPFPFTTDGRAPESHCPNPTGNLPMLAMAATGEAGLHVVPDDDGVIRRYAFAFSTSQAVVPLLGTAAAIAGNIEQREVLQERATVWAQSPPLLRYRPSTSFKTVRFSDVLEAGAGSEALGKALEGKTILVGVSALGVEDLRSTSIEHDIPGVFVHANAFAALLDGDVLATDLEGADVLWGCLVLLLLGLATPFTRGARQVLPVTTVVALAYIGLFFSKLSAGYAFPLALPLLAWTSWAIARLAFEYLRNKDARAQAAAVREAFQHYLAPTVVEQLVENPDMLRLGGERRVITAFFSDVAGFTTISEALEPQELAELLNECLGGMTEVILEEGGTIDKYIGDAIVAMFGAPLEQADHADRALRAAVRCQEILETLRPSWRERGWPEVIVRIGVNSGPATVGNMGSDQRFDYTMLGDTVNLAARLEGANKAYGTLILAGEKTEVFTDGGPPLRELDTVAVKGKNKGVRIFTIDDDPDRRAASDAALAKYRAQDWDGALAAYEALGDDETAIIFRDRIDELKTNPPPEDWDGVYRLTTK